MRPLAGLLIVAMTVLTGGCAAPVGVAIASYAADGALMLATDKTSTDHFISLTSGKDCAVWRAVKDQPICAARKPGEENPYDVDLDAPHREVGEGGMVSVYSASRDGGRLLTDDEAKTALETGPASATDRPDAASSPAAAAIGKGAPPVLVADVTWVEDAAPAATGRKPPARKPAMHAGRRGGKKAVAAAHPPAPARHRAAVQRKTAPRAAAVRQPKPAPARQPATGSPGSVP